VSDSHGDLHAYVCTHDCDLMQQYVHASACCGKPPLCHSACPQLCRNQASARVVSRAVRAQRWLVAAHHVLSTICSCPDATMHPLAFSHVHTRSRTHTCAINSSLHMHPLMSCCICQCAQCARGHQWIMWMFYIAVVAIPSSTHDFAWHVHTNAHTRTHTCTARVHPLMSCSS